MMSVTSTSDQEDGIRRIKANALGNAPATNGLKPNNEPNATGFDLMSDPSISLDDAFGGEDTSILGLERAAPPAENSTILPITSNNVPATLQNAPNAISVAANQTIGLKATKSTPSPAATKVTVTVSQAPVTATKGLTTLNPRIISVKSSQRVSSDRYLLPNLGDISVMKPLIILSNQNSGTVINTTNASKPLGIPIYNVPAGTGAPFKIVPQMLQLPGGVKGINQTPIFVAKMGSTSSVSADGTVTLSPIMAKGGTGGTMPVMVSPASMPIVSSLGSLPTSLIATSKFGVTATSTTTPMVAKVIIPGQQGLGSVVPIASNASVTDLNVTPSSIQAPIFSTQPIKIINSAGQTVSTILTSPGKVQPSIYSPVKMAGASVASSPPSPSKQTIVLNKVSLSPKTPTKITMIPVPMVKTPPRIAPAPSAAAGSVTTVVPSCVSTAVPITFASTAMSGAVAKGVSTLTLSPSKVVIKPSVLAPSVANSKSQHSLLKITTSSTIMNDSIIAAKVLTSSVTTVTTTTATSVGPMVSIVKSVSLPSSIAPNAAGGKVSFIKLVPQSSITTLTSGPKISTVVSSSSDSAPMSVVVSETTGKTTTGVPKIVPLQTLQMGSKTGTQHILVPASNLPNVPAIKTSSAAGGSTPSYVMVPAHYVTQLQHGGASVVTVTQASASSALPVLSASCSTEPSGPDTSLSATLFNKIVNSTLLRQRKPCNCTKSQCLKLYCDCFANGEFCNLCNCNNCFNNLEHEEDRQRAIKACLERNPSAFHPKIGKGREGETERRHNKGCNCKRSGCLKNYCECYEARILCGSACKCVGCKNIEESLERKTLIDLADAADVRAQQQTAATSKLSAQLNDITAKFWSTSLSHSRVPLSFFKTEFVEATTSCLLARLNEVIHSKASEQEQERFLLQEFGRCFQHAIDAASQRMQ